MLSGDQSRAGSRTRKHNENRSKWDRKRVWNGFNYAAARGERDDGEMFEFDRLGLI